MILGGRAIRHRLGLAQFAKRLLVLALLVEVARGLQRLAGLSAARPLRLCGPPAHQRRRKLQRESGREGRTEQRAIDSATTDSVSLHHSVSRASLPAAMNAAKV